MTYLSSDAVRSLDPDIYKWLMKKSANSEQDFSPQNCLAIKPACCIYPWISTEKFQILKVIEIWNNKLNFSQKFW